jgi:molybdate transport system regulatory protein
VRDAPRIRAACPALVDMPPPLYLRLELASGRLGHGKIALLEHIRDGQSLAAAARAMGMSYKRAWELLAALNEMFDEPVTISHPGRNVAGATTLTPFGERVVALFRAMERRADEATAAAREELAAASRRAPRAARADRSLPAAKPARKTTPATKPRR